MHRHRPDLIVPIRDRRQHRRILTLRHAGYAALLAIVVFFAITIRSEMRHGSADGDYGRLYHRELPPVSAPQVKPVEIVKEQTPIPDQNAADPMLITHTPPIESATVTPIGATVTPIDATMTRERNSRVVIVGGREGVAAIDNAPPREKVLLKGGVFKQ